MSRVTFAVSSPTGNVPLLTTVDMAAKSHWNVLLRRYSAIGLRTALPFYFRIAGRNAAGAARGPGGATSANGALRKSPGAPRIVAALSGVDLRARRAEQKF